MYVSNYTNNTGTTIIPVTNEFPFPGLSLDEKLRYCLEYYVESASLVAKIIDEDSFKVLNEEDFLTWAELGES